MHVGIMSGHVPRPTLEESLDAILGHDIRHLQVSSSPSNRKRRRQDMAVLNPLSLHKRCLSGVILSPPQ